MGSWSPTIMGGDDPLDILAEIYDLLGLEQFPDDNEEENTPVKIKRQLEERQNYLIAELSIDADRVGSPALRLMVLGWMLLSAGAKINEATKVSIMQACDKDQWALKDIVRLGYVNELKDAILNSDGLAPVELTNEHLFDKLSTYLNGEDE